MDLKIKLNELLRDQQNLNALEAFAREGDWFTERIMSGVTTLTCIEINENYINQLAKRFPHAEILCGDSHTILKNTGYFKQKFDFISLDNPQGLFCKKKYCEHFNILPQALHFLKPGGALIFNVNLKPYDDRIVSKSSYDNYGNDFDQWMKLRGAYYGVDSDLSPEFIRIFYSKLFKSQGRKTLSHSFYNLDGSTFNPQSAHHIIRALWWLK